MLTIYFMRGGQGHAIAENAEEKEAVTHQATNFRDQACLDHCNAVVMITTA